MKNSFLRKAGMLALSLGMVISGPANVWADAASGEEIAAEDQQAPEETRNQSDGETGQDVSEDTETVTDPALQEEIEETLEVEANPAEGESEEVFETEDKDADVNTEASELSLEEQRHTYMGSTMGAEVMDLAGAGTGSAAIRIQNPGMLAGIDASEWNKTIDWKKMYKAGVRFVVVKVAGRYYGGGGLYEDPMYKQNIEGALAAGMKVGVYFFSQAITEAEGIEEAKYICSRIKKYNITLPVFMDYEYENSDYRLSRGGNQSDRTKVIRAFCKTVQSYGYTAGIYASDTFLCNYFYGYDLSMEYQIWIAQWPLNEDRKCYSDFNVGDKTPGYNFTGYVDFWQFSDAGKIDGNGTTYADLDFMYVQTSSLDEQRAAFVEDLYVNFLNRSSDKQGMNTWLNAINQGWTGADLVRGFYFSDEFQNSGLSDQKYMERMYAALLHRSPDRSGLATWLDYLSKGITRQYVLQGFVNSNEFRSNCTGMGVMPGNYVSGDILDQNPQVTFFTNRLYVECLNRYGEKSGLRFWVQYILNGNSGSEVAEGFFFSDEMERRNLSDEQFVTMAYSTMLNRKPDTNGMNTWLGILADGGSRDEIFYGFAESEEWKQICANYGIIH